MAAINVQIGSHRVVLLYLLLVIVLICGSGSVLNVEAAAGDHRGQEKISKVATPAATTDRRVQEKISKTARKPSSPTAAVKSPAVTTAAAGNDRDKSSRTTVPKPSSPTVLKSPSAAAAGSDHVQVNKTTTKPVPKPSIPANTDHRVEEKTTKNVPKPSIPATSDQEKTSKPVSKPSIPTTTDHHVQEKPNKPVLEPSILPATTDHHDVQENTSNTVPKPSIAPTTAATKSPSTAPAPSDHVQDTTSTTVSKPGIPTAAAVKSPATVSNVIKDYSKLAKSRHQTRCTIIDCNQDMKSSFDRQVWVQITTHWPVHTRIQNFDEILRQIKAEDGLLVIDVFAYNSNEGRLVYKIHLRNEGAQVVDCSAVVDKFVPSYKLLDKHCPSTT